MEIILDDETAKIFDRISSYEGDDPWELSIMASVTPSELELFAQDELMEDNHGSALEQLHEFLGHYKATVSSYLDGKIENRPYLDKEAQLEVYWKSPVRPREEFGL